MAECQELLTIAQGGPTEDDKENAIKLLKEFSYYFIQKTEKTINSYRKELEENPESRKNSKVVKAMGAGFAIIPVAGKAAQKGINEAEHFFKHKNIKNKASCLANLITYFSLKPDSTRMVLIQSALYIFYSYEPQFLQVTCENGSDSRAMMKLGEDASERVLDYLITNSKDLKDKPLTRNLVTQGLVEGKSILSTTTALRSIRRGRSIRNVETKNLWTTNDVFEKPGIILETPNNEMEFYDKSNENLSRSTRVLETCRDKYNPAGSKNLNQFGYRRAFPWENSSKIRDTYVKKVIDEQPKFILNKNDFATHYGEIQNYVINRKLNEGNPEEKLLVMHKALNSTHTNTEKILKSTVHIQENVQVIRNRQEDNSNLVASFNKEELGHALSKIQDNTMVNDLTIYLDSLMRQGINSGSKAQEFMSDITSKATTIFKVTQESMENPHKLKSLVGALREESPEMDSNKQLLKGALYGLVDWVVDFGEFLSKKDGNDDDDQTVSENSQ